MGRSSVDLVGRPIAYVAVYDNQGRPALRLPENRERVLDEGEIVGVADPQNIPSVAEEASGHILGEGDTRVALDADVIVVVDPAQVIEAEMTCERGRLRAHPFHEAAVAADRIDVVAEEIETQSVVAVR